MKACKYYILILLIPFVLTCESDLTVDTFLQSANATSAPVIASSTPADGDTSFAINGTLQFTFDQTVVASSVTANITNTTCAGTVQLSADNFANCIQMNAQPSTSDNKTFSIKPAADLGSGTAYKLKIRQAVIGSNDKNVASDITINFTAFGVDSTAPTMNSQNPANGATGIAINSTIAVTFSEPMNTGTVTVNTANTTCAGFSFQVSSDNFANCIRMNAAPTASGGNATFTVTPNANLANSTTYKIRITTAVQDVAGNALATQFEQATGFTTVGAGPALLITEIGNNMGGTSNDFIEIYNNSGSNIADLSQYKLMRDSACSIAGGMGNQWTLPAVALNAGNYAVFSRSGNTLGISAPNDLLGAIDLSGDCYAITTVGTTAASVTAFNATGVIDFVGFTPAGSSVEGTPVTGVGSSTARSAVRCPNANSDTADNSADFQISTAQTAGAANTNCI